MHKVITVAHTKGGVGKSTLTNAAAYNYASQGYKTILVDLDPQATQTGGFMGYGYGSFSGDNISNIANLFKNENVEPINIKTIKYIDNPLKGKIRQPHYLEEDLVFDFCPSNQDLLTMTESDDFTRKEKIQKICKFLNGLKKDYDKIIVDTPPTFGIITTAVLKVSDSALIPIPTKNIDTDGMVGFFRQLDVLFEYDINLKKIVVVPNMYDKKVNDAKETLREIQRTPNLLQETKNLRKLECVVTSPFPQRACIQEAPAYNMFLVPAIMDFTRSKNSDIILSLEAIFKELEITRASTNK
jgi:cellulose biosynthesis protein BcsQ